jgi:glutathione synthase/RimK-type ligase-like ATP-grasp enzyme
MSPRVAFATYVHDPVIASDDSVVRDMLWARDIEVEATVWDDPSVDWSAVDLCLLRSTWDYHHRHQEFLAWVQDVSAVTTLWNPAPVVRWNTHKRYLHDLAIHGVATVPTRWLPAGSRADLATILESSGWSAAIVKPAIGADAEGVTLVSRQLITDGQEHLERLLRRGDVLVQPFLPSVRSIGERSLIVVDGVVTHAWRRHSPLDGDNEEITLVAPNPDEIALAHAALAATPGPVLYARVDLIHDDDGQPLLSELELIEPFLALRLWPAAAVRLADAIVRLLGTGR